MRNWGTRGLNNGQDGTGNYHQGATTNTGSWALLLATMLYCPLMANQALQLKHITCKSTVMCQVHGNKNSLFVWSKCSYGKEVEDKSEKLACRSHSRSPSMPCESGLDSVFLRAMLLNHDESRMQISLQSHWAQLLKLCTAHRHLAAGMSGGWNPAVHLSKPGALAQGVSTCILHSFFFNNCTKYCIN